MVPFCGILLNPSKWYHFAAFFYTPLNGTVLRLFSIPPHMGSFCGFFLYPSQWYRLEGFFYTPPNGTVLAGFDKSRQMTLFWGVLPYPSNWPRPEVWKYFWFRNIFKVLQSLPFFVWLFFWLFIVILHLVFLIFSMFSHFYMHIILSRSFTGETNFLNTSSAPMFMKLFLIVIIVFLYHLASRLFDSGLPVSSYGQRTFDGVVRGGRNVFCTFGARIFLKLCQIVVGMSLKRSALRVSNSCRSFSFYVRNTPSGTITALEWLRRVDESRYWFSIRNFW